MRETQLGARCQGPFWQTAELQAEHGGMLGFGAAGG